MIGIILVVLSLLAVEEYVRIRLAEDSIESLAALPMADVDRLLRQASTPEDVTRCVLEGQAVAQERLQALNEQQVSVVMKSQSIVKAKRLAPDIRLTRKVLPFLFLSGAFISWMLLRKKRVWQCGDCGDAAILPKGAS